MASSRDAICGYTISGPVSRSNGAFSYSDGIHHEVMLDELQKDTEYDISTSCIDDLGSARVKTSKIKYVVSQPDKFAVQNFTSSLISGQIFSIYTTVTDNGVGLGEISKDRFDLEIREAGKKSGDYTNLLPDYVLEDMGSGVYKMTFVVPSKLGNFTLYASLDGIEYTKAISISDINFQVVYDFVKENGEVTFSNLVAKNIENLSVGLATDDKSDIVSNTDAIKISTKTENGVIYFFVTKPDAKLDRVSKLLSKGGFLDLINPSFGDFIGDECTLNAELKFSNLGFDKVTSISNGKYLLYISNKGTDERTNVTDLSIVPK